MSINGVIQNLSSFNTLPTRTYGIVITDINENNPGLTVIVDIVVLDQDRS